MTKYRKIKGDLGEIRVILSENKLSTSELETVILIYL